MIFFENTFFAAKMAFKDNESCYWDLIRKIKTVPGAKGELLEIIAQCLQSPLENYFIFEIQDFDMCQDLTGLGAQRIGYLAEESAGHKIDGWGEIWSARVRRVDEIDPYASYRKNFFFLSELEHRLEITNDFFLETFFKRDRMFWGITTGDPKWLSNTKKINQILKPKKIDKWSALIETRKSTLGFNQEAISSDELNNFLKNSLYKRADKHLHYGSAGGFNNIKAYLAIRGVAGLDDGIYKVDSETATLNFIKKFDNFDMLEQFLFLPDELAKASVFLFFAAEFSEMSEKYGERAIRFSLLSIGGALQQAHLTANALGLQYRTIGGFDELQCAKVLEIKGREYLACAAMLGK